MIGIVFKLIVVAGGIIKRSRGGFFNGLLGLLRIRAAVKIWAEIFGSQFNLNHDKTRGEGAEDRQSHTNVPDWLSLPDNHSESLP